MVLSRLSRCHANVAPVIELIAAYTCDENGRIREENRGFFAFCAVRDRWGMILPYEVVGVAENAFSLVDIGEIW